MSSGMISMYFFPFNTLGFPGRNTAFISFLDKIVNFFLSHFFPSNDSLVIANNEYSLNYG